MLLHEDTYVFLHSKVFTMTFLGRKDIGDELEHVQKIVFVQYD